MQSCVGSQRKNSLSVDFYNVYLYDYVLRACIHCIAIDLSKLFVDCTLCRIMPCLDVIKITNGKLGANCAFLRGRG